MAVRNRVVDVARGLGMLLVVLGHNPLVWQEQGELHRVIYSFHMPLFFFLSGVFFSPQKTFGETFWEKSDALLKPYVVTLLPLGLWGAFAKGGDFSNHLWRMLQATGPAIEWTPLWFLPHLLVVILLSWALIHALPMLCDDGWRRWAFVVALLFAGICTIRLFWRQPVLLFGVPDVLLGLPWSLDIAPITVAYHLMGYFCSRWVREFSPRLTESLMAMVVFAASHVMADQTIDLNSRKFEGYFFPVLESLSGIYLALLASHFLQHVWGLGRSLAIAGVASLFVLIFHWPIQGKATNLLEKLMPDLQTFAMLLGFCIASALPVAIWWIVVRSKYLSLLFFPFRNNKVLGTRQLLR